LRGRSGLHPARWDAETAREFALGLTDVGRIDLSTVAWRRAAEAGNDAKDYERLGLAWAVLGNHPEAIAAFSHAVDGFTVATSGTLTSTPPSTSGPSGFSGGVCSGSGGASPNASSKSM